MLSQDTTIFHSVQKCLQLPKLFLTSFFKKKFKVFLVRALLPTVTTTACCYNNCPLLQPLPFRTSNNFNVDHNFFISGWVFVKQDLQADQTKLDLN